MTHQDSTIHAYDNDNPPVFKRKIEFAHKAFEKLKALADVPRERAVQYQIKARIYAAINDDTLTVVYAETSRNSDLVYERSYTKSTNKYVTHIHYEDIDRHGDILVTLNRYIPDIVRCIIESGFVPKLFFTQPEQQTE